MLMEKEPSQKETINDLHGDITNLARTVAHVRAEELYDRLGRVVLAEGLLDDARAILEESAPPACPGPGETTDEMLERAYWYFLASWMGRNGTAGTDRLDYQIAVRWTKSGGAPSVRFKNAVESMPAWHRRLQNVVILQRDAFEILDRFEDDAATAIYCDPPYPTETRTSHDNKTGGNGRYAHEFSHGGNGLFAGGDDHDRLAAMLRAYKHARIVVSTYDCPRYRDLYKGWTFVDCRMLKLLHQQNGRGQRQKEAPEVLIVNGPSFTEGWKA